MHYCPICGHQTSRSNATFCDECGTRLKATSTPPSWSTNRRESKYGLVHDEQLAEAIWSSLDTPHHKRISIGLGQLIALTGSLTLRTGNLEGLQYATNLAELTIDGRYAATDLAALSGLIRLRNLHLMNLEVPNLEPLAKLRRLTQLRLEHLTKVTDLAPLARLSQLTTLHIEGLLVHELSPLSSLKGLRQLALIGPDTAVLLGPLASLTGLSELTLSLHGKRDLEPLGGLTRLTELSLQFQRTTNLGPLAALNELAALTISFAGGFGPHTPFDLGPLANLKGLRKLTFIGMDEVVDDLSPLAKLTGLTSLTLFGINADVDLGPLSNLTGLTQAVLHANKAHTAYDLSALLELPNLTDLHLLGALGHSWNRTVFESRPDLRVHAH